MRLSALSLCIAGLSIPLMAQVPDDLDQELAALLNTPIQGASKREQRLMDSPQAIEVLTGEEIRQMGIYRLADALKLMTSVDVMELDTQATYVTIRGAMQQGAPRTVQFLIDGVPLHNGEAGAVDLDTLPVPVDLIDKVEVVRGPSSTLYGANAVAGVIAITTKRPTPGAAGGLRYSRANNNTNRGAADLELGGSKLGVTAGYSGASIDGDRVQTEVLTTGKSALLDANAAHQRSSFARVQYAFNDASLVWASTGEANKKFGTSVSPGFTYQVFKTNTLQVGWSQTWTSTFRTEARVSRLIQQTAVSATPALINVYHDPRLGAEYTWRDFNSNLMEIQANWDPTATIHLVAGVDRTTSEAAPAPFMGYAAARSTHGTGGFMNADWNITPVLALSLGARVENQSLGGSESSPRAALVWSLSPTSTLRGGYYSSTRSPQIAERYMDFSSVLTGPPVPEGAAGKSIVASNPALAPEKISSLEVGYRKQISAVTLDVTAFRMKFSQLINQSVTSSGLQPGSPTTYAVVQQFVNAGSATNQGLEVAVKWQAARTWTLGANATVLDYTLDSNGQTPSYTPNFKANVWNRYAKGRFTSYVAYQHVNSVIMQSVTATGPSTLQTPRPAIDEMHLNLGWEFVPGLVVSTYARNAFKSLVPQGAGGAVRSGFEQGSRREYGGTVAYRF